VNIQATIHLVFLSKSEKHLERGFFDVINMDKNDACDILKDAILSVYNNYPHKQQIAAEGAAWIEDKWLIQDAQQQIISIFDNLT